MGVPLSDSDWDKMEHPHRRSGEKRMESIVNNAWLRFLQFALSIIVSMIALPLAAWGLTTVIERLTLIDAKLFTLQLANAENAIKLGAVQKDAADALEMSRSLRERVLALEIRLNAVPPARNVP